MKNFRHQHQRPKKNTLVIGRQAIVDALKTGKQLDRIYMQTAVHGSFIDEIKTLALQHNVPINNVPAEKLNNFNVFNHEGCVAQISKIQYQNLQDVISFIVENGEVPLFIILDGITDIRKIINPSSKVITNSAYLIATRTGTYHIDRKPPTIKGQRLMTDYFKSKPKSK